MNTEKKPTHNTVDESLEAFNPFPASHKTVNDKHNHWYQQFLNWLKSRH